MSIYAFSDLHGNYNLWEKMNTALFTESDTLIFLGDACDRGKDSYKLMKELLYDERVVYIMGNHELMFINAIDDESMMWLHYNNGGHITWTGWEADNRNQDVIDKIRQLPAMHTYRRKDGSTVYLSHAGFDPGEFTSIENLGFFVWDRDHLLQDCPDDWEDFIIHGHTPIPSLRGLLAWFDDKYEGDWDPDSGALWYGNGKIDIDMGTPYSDYAMAIDLDTFEEFIFYDDADNKSMHEECERLEVAE